MAKNDLVLWCTFCKFSDNANNFKRHMNNKKHNKEKTKNYTAYKYINTAYKW